MAASDKNKYSESSLRMLDAIDEAIYFADPDTYEILYTNSKFNSIWGDHGKNDGSQCFRVLQGFDEPCPFCTNEIIFHQKPGKVHVWEFRNKNNSRWYRCYDRVVEWLDGRLVRMEMAVDITDQKQDENRLRLSETKYRSVFESANDAFFIFNDEGKIIDVNQAATDTYGYSREEMIGKNVTNLIQPDYHSEFKKMISEVRKKGTFKGETIDIRKDGTSFPTEVTGTMIMYEDNPHLLGVVRDVSEIKAREQDLLLKNLVFDNSVASNFTTDSNWKITNINKAFYDMWGYEDEDIVTDMLFPSLLFLENESLQIKNELEKHTKWQGTFTALKVDGSTFIAEASASRITDARHEIHGYHFSVMDVTESVAAEKRIRESEEKFQSLYHQAPDMYASVFPLTGEIQECNKTLLEKTGYSKDELIGQPVTKLYAHSSFEKAIATFQQFMDKGDVRDMELVLISKDGTQFDVSLNITAIRDEQGTIIQGLSSMRDITEQKSLRRKIEQSEKSLKNAQGIAKMGNWELDIEENKLSWSDEIYRIFDLEPQEVEATFEGFIEHIHPEDREIVSKAYVNSLETKEPYEIIHRLKLKDGSVRYVREMCDTDFAEDGTPLRSEGIVQDITELQQQEQEIVREKLFNESVLEAMPGIFYLFDEQGKFLKWNNTLSNLSGISYDEVGLKSPLDFIAKKHRKKVGNAIENAFRTGEVLVEADFLAKGRENIPFYFSGIRVQFEGKYLLLGVGIDISKRKQADKKLEMLALELKRSNIELERFASVASHDLQEPLRMVASYTQLLEKRYKDKIDDKASRYIHYAVDGAERMQTLINDLLQYSRISTRGDTFRKIDMNKVVNMAVENLQNRIDKSGARLEIQELPHLSGDAGQLTRLFMNLISNALKFAGEGVKPQIKIYAKKEKHHWKFSVSDNGIGIDHKYDDKVFVIFQRLHSRDDYEGTGIGLAICKRIVERHGGKIWFDSENETGTTFFFTLPLNVVK